ncbi:MAG TPA: ABC transporter ATP-binding protein [Pseudonocardiaceae bacterium]
MRLDIADLTVSLGGRPVVDGAGLTVPEGSFVGLVGPNGSGKTTLLRTVYRSLRPEAGAVLLGGEDVWRLSARESARRTAAVLQDGGGSGALTVAEVVALGRNPHQGLFAREGAEDRSLVASALAQTGMEGYAGRLFGSLSGGERQRVLLARALAQRPRLLVLDELTNHLDIRARFELLELVRTIGITSLAVLHELDLAVRCCDQLVVLSGGRVAAAGPVLNALTPAVLRDVFGVNAVAERHADGVVRVTYHASPLAATTPASGEPGCG